MCKVWHYTFWGKSVENVPFLLCTDTAVHCPSVAPVRLKSRFLDFFLDKEALWSSSCMSPTNLCTGKAEEQEQAAKGKRWQVFSQAGFPARWFVWRMMTWEQCATKCGWMPSPPDCSQLWCRGTIETPWLSFSCTRSNISLFLQFTD